MRKIKIKKPAGQKPLLPKGQYGFVIGNGTSRQDFDLKPLMDYGIFIACNWFYKNEFRPHVTVCSDAPITKSVWEENKNFGRRNHFYTWFPKPGSGMKKIPTPEKFAAGPSAAAVAVKNFKCPKVFLIGMDFFGFGSSGRHKNGSINNLYAGKKHYVAKDSGAPTYRNWQRRFHWLLIENPWVEFYHVNPFDGKSPERLRGLPNFHQITWENLMDHLENDAELVDTLEKTQDDYEIAYSINPDDARAVIERQLAGQENVIFKDLIHPDDLLDIRKGVRDQWLSGNRFPVSELGGFLLHMPLVGLINPGDKRNPPLWMNDNQLTDYTFKETHQRFEMMKAFYSENPDKLCKAIKIDNIPMEERKTELSQHFSKMEHSPDPTKMPENFPKPPAPPPIPKI